MTSFARQLHRALPHKPLRPLRACQMERQLRYQEASALLSCFCCLPVLCNVASLPKHYGLRAWICLATVYASIASIILCTKPYPKPLAEGLLQRCSFQSHNAGHGAGCRLAGRRGGQKGRLHPKASHWVFASAGICFVLATSPQVPLQQPELQLQNLSAQKSDRRKGSLRQVSTML